MSNENEKIWFNQELLLCYGKKIDEVSSNLSLTLGISTKDFQQFSIPNLLFRITDPVKSSHINLDRCTSRKVLNFFKETFIKKEGRFQTRLYKDNFIKVAFRPTAEEILVIIAISNDAKEVVCICDLNDFEEIIEAIRSYLRICTDLSCQSLLTRKEIYNQTNILRTLPSQIFENQPKCISNNFIAEDESNINNDLSNFLDSKIPEIKLEIPEAKDGRQSLEDGSKRIERKDVYYGSLIQTVFNNNISEVEKFCSLLVTSDNPLLDLISNLNDKVRIEEYDLKDNSPIERFLPSITDEQLKSILYVSRLSYFRTMKKMMENNKVISPKDLSIEASYYIPIDPSLVKDYNKNIAIDILLIISYVREMYKNLNHIEGNVSNNKSLLYTQLRLFFDPLMISFISLLDVDATINTITGRYNQYKKDGVFKEFEQYLSKYKCSQPSVEAILVFIKQVILKLQSDLNESLVKINDPSKKDKFKFDIETIKLFNYEQITKEISRIETNSLPKNMNLSKEVSNLFGIVVPVDEETILGRFIRENISEVPLDIRTDFLLEINRECKNKKYDFNKNKDVFDIDKLGDNIILSLWVWNPEEGNPETYEDFEKHLIMYSKNYPTYESINSLKTIIKNQSVTNNETSNNNVYFNENIVDNFFD
jgi:hypothetical protein